MVFLRIPQVHPSPNSKNPSKIFPLFFALNKEGKFLLIAFEIFQENFFSEFSKRKK